MNRGRSLTQKVFWPLIIFILVFGVDAVSEDQANVSDTKNKADPALPSYIIGPGDILDVLVWEEERLSKEVLVRIDGKITFPLLDDIQAAGRKPMDLKNEIAEGLKLYVENPVVTVTVTNPGSKKFYVLGEVERTNEYPLLKQTTVLQAFAIAGGFTEWASKKEILLIRRENGKDKIFTINYKDIVKGKNPKSNFLIQENDTIVIP